MKIEFDKNKSDKNEKERHLPFTKVNDFEWESAIVKQDFRKEYPEPRFIAAGFLAARLHILCFTPIADGIRVISFRKANLREVKDYETEITHQ